MYGSGQSVLKKKTHPPAWNIDYKHVLQNELSNEFTGLHVWKKFKTWLFHAEILED